MAMTKEAKEHGVNMLAALIIDEMQYRNPGIDRNKAFAQFSKSKTYELLCNINTDLWTRGSGYIFEMYENELNGKPILPGLK
jgi:hypothetical protein